MLIARENCFYAQDDRALMEFGTIEKRSQVALRVRQGVVIADQNDSGFGYFMSNIVQGKNFLVGAIGVTKVAQVFTSGGAINGANLSLHAGDGVELSGAAS